MICATHSDSAHCADEYNSEEWKVLVLAEIKLDMRWGLI
jgi:hypothetical protein